MLLLKPLGFGKNHCYATVNLLGLFLIATATFVGVCWGVDPPYGQLSVSKDGKLTGSDGSPVQLIGMVLFWSQWAPGFWTANVVKQLKCFWKVNCIRAAMGVNAIDGGTGKETGYKSDPSGQMELLDTVVKACIAEGIYVIIDWHTSSELLEDAKAFFAKVSAKYAGVPNILYETFNEPISGSGSIADFWHNDLKPYHEAIIKTIRANDPKNVIICGTPEWDQDVDIAGADKIDTDPNICYTEHFYAASHHQSYIDKIQTALNNNTCIFVTEYGTVNGGGDGAPDETWMKTWWAFLDKNKISYMNWSVGNKTEAASVLAKGTADDLENKDDFSASGTLVYNKITSMTTNAPTTGC